MNILVYDHENVRGENNSTAIQSATTASGLDVGVYYCHDGRTVARAGAYAVRVPKPDDLNYVILHDTNRIECANFVKPALLDSLSAIRYTGGQGFRNTSGSDIWIQRAVTETESITKDEAHSIVEWWMRSCPSDDIPFVLGGENYALMLLSSLLDHAWSIEIQGSGVNALNLLDQLEQDGPFPHGLTLERWPPEAHTRIWQRLESVYQRNRRGLPSQSLREALERLKSSLDHCEELTVLRRGLLGS